MNVSQIIENVLNEHPKAAEDAKKMEPAVHYLAGLVLREVGGNALMSMVYIELRKKLGII